MDDKAKEELLKTFVLSLHAESTGIVAGVNYKDHRNIKHPVDVQKILYKSVDAYRYILAILNLWDIDASTFINALSQKDDFLHYRHVLSSKKWNGQPVALFDMDDVIAEFRVSFCRWVTETTGCFLDPQSKEYYATEALKAACLNNEVLFKTFVDSHGLLSLDVDSKYTRLLSHLQSEGYWIQIVTARPEHNSTAFYDTYSWLSKHGIMVDGIAFTPEKFVWLTDQPYYSRGKYFAVDDSPKHAGEYAKHGVSCIVPEKSYNTEVSTLKNILYVPRESDPIEYVKQLL